MKNIWKSGLWNFKEIIVDIFQFNSVFINMEDPRL